MNMIVDLDAATVLQGVAAKQFGKGVSVAAQDPRRAAPGLLPAERAAIADAVPSRRREYAAGRAAARAALSGIGIYGQPVLMGDDRAPVWPGNAVGSISHSDLVCLAAVAPGHRVQSLGIDVESADPLPADLWDTVLTPSETAWIATRPEAQRGRLAKIIFSAKECAYKCQYPLTGVVLGFDAFEVALDTQSKEFHVTRAGSPVGSDPANRMTGRYSVLMGQIVTTLVLRRT